MRERSNICRGLWDRNDVKVAVVDENLEKDVRILNIPYMSLTSINTGEAMRE